MAFFREGRQITLLARRMRKFSVFVPVAASCAAGALISYTGLWLQSLVTATSFMVLGCFNKIGVIAWGIACLPSRHALAHRHLGGAGLYRRLLRVQQNQVTVKSDGCGWRRAPPVAARWGDLAAGPSIGRVFSS